MEYMQKKRHSLQKRSEQLVKKQKRQQTKITLKKMVHIWKTNIRENKNNHTKTTTQQKQTQDEQKAQAKTTKNQQHMKNGNAQ